MMYSYEIDESDCCGNGCSNCILDGHKSLPNQISINKIEGRLNCLNKDRFYELLSVQSIVEPYIQKLKFQLNDQIKTNTLTSVCNEGKNEKSNLMLYIPPGHHIMMKIGSCRRPYSPFWIDIEKFQFEFLVNLYPNGEMSKYIKQLKVGDLVQFKGPIGSFYHEMNKIENLLIFSNGIAVAPIIPIIEEIINNEDDMTKIHYFGCFRNFKHFYFREKFINFQRYWNFNGKFYLAKEICKEQGCDIIQNCDTLGWCYHLKMKVKYGEKVFNCKLKNEDIIKYLKEFDLSRIQIVLCGSKDFENFVKNSLDNLNISKEKIHVL